MGASLIQSLSPGLKGVLCSFIALCLLAEPAFGITRHYEFDIKLQNLNGKFPGPRIVAREGDQLHGIRRLRSGWADGPAYITQCPIQTGQSCVYNFTIVGRRGKLWWHAHMTCLPLWESAGEWFNGGPKAIINQALQTGGGPNASDAFTINGLSGSLYNRSAK
ncbi:hypothetical protein CISIN_1g0479042mg, partial [Citrus sinensis]